MSAEDGLCEAHGAPAVGFGACAVCWDEVEFTEEAMDVDKAFRSFIETHEWFVPMLEDLIFERIEEVGFRRMGFRTFWERMRWEIDRPVFRKEYGLGDEFGMNDKLQGRMVRHILQRNPHWEGLFELRRLRT